MNNQNRTNEEIQKEIDLIDKQLRKMEARRINDISTNKLIAVSVLLFAFIVSMSLFGG
jgi:hypothetical protein